MKHFSFLSSCGIFCFWGDRKNRCRVKKRENFIIILFVKRNSLSALHIERLERTFRISTYHFIHGYVLVIIIIVTVMLLLVLILYVIFFLSFWEKEQERKRKMCVCSGCFWCCRAVNVSSFVSVMRWEKYNHRSKNLREDKTSS